MSELQNRAANLHRMLDEHVAAAMQGDPAIARNIAYDMLQVLTGLYTAAYVAAAEQARRKGKAS